MTEETMRNFKCLARMAEAIGASLEPYHDDGPGGLRLSGPGDEEGDQMAWFSKLPENAEPPENVEMYQLMRCFAWLMAMPTRETDDCKAFQDAQEQFMRNVAAGDLKQ